MNYTFAAISHNKNPAVARLKAAADAVFKIINDTNGSRGILIGGAAVVFLGSNRMTTDLDINVSKFPSFKGVDPDFVYDRPGPNKWRRKLTFKRNDPDQSIKCDLSISKAQIVREFYPKHTVRIPGLEGVAVAGPGLLLADKICTLSDRKDSPGGKYASDLEDIIFCIEFLHAYEARMDPLLRNLYTAQQWKIVRDMLSAELVQVAEIAIDVVPLDSR